MLARCRRAVTFLAIVAATQALPLQAADTVTRLIGPLPPGKTVTIRFDATVTGTPASVSNQGSVGGTNFATVLTDDPDDPTGTADPTVTPIQLTAAVAVASSANPSTFGQAVTFTATVTGTGATPTGTVQFKDGGVNLGGAQALDASGQAAIAVSLGVGVHAITADYSGSTVYNAATGSLAGGQVVNAGTGSLSIDDVTILEGNGGTANAVFTVTLSSPPGVPVTVNFATADGTAQAGTDYLGAAGTLTFTGAQVTRTIAVPVVGDTVQEADETFTVTLSAPTNATVAKGVGVGTIRNDDASSGLPAITVDDPSVTEGQAGVALAVLTLRLSRASTNAVTVEYATADATATAGTDYVGRFGTITFAAGATIRYVVVPVIGDTLVEGDETFRVFLTNGVGADVAKGIATVTIRDDDPATAAVPIPVYRLYSDNLTFEHLYTTDLNEYTVLGNAYDPVRHVGWKQEGVAFHLLDSSGTFSGTFGRPFYRLYAPSILQHHWTTDTNEVTVLLGTGGWQYEGVVGYMLPEPTTASGVVPLFRLWNGGAFHLWTTDTNEKDVLSAPGGGWMFEGIAGNVLP